MGGATPAFMPPICIMSRARNRVKSGAGRGGALQVGFVPERDCAPLIYAQESGLFDRYELRVDLRRQRRWTDIRDRIICGELDAAHAPATLPFVTNLGLDSDECAAVSGLVMSLEGNGILISRELWADGVRDASALRERIYRDWHRRSYTFGVACPYSPAYIILRRWLRSGDIAPHIEIAIKVVPPEQVFPMLKLGYLDGYCGAEPWISLATEARAGGCVASSADLARFHPEKVLMVRCDFAEERAPEHERLIAALIEACHFCEQPENRALLGELLAPRRYVNAPANCLAGGPVRHCEPSDATLPGLANVPSLFHRSNANDPTDDKAAWLLAELYETMDQQVLKPRTAARAPVLKNVFRRDIFGRALTAMDRQAQTLREEADSFETAVKQTA